MEQLKLTEIEMLEINEEWLSELLKKVSEDLGMKIDAFKIIPNRLKGVVVGYSINFGTSLAAKTRLKRPAFSVHKNYSKAVTGYKKEKELMNPEGFVKYEFKDISAFNESLRRALVEFVNDYTPSERFGCCHRFAECSDAKKCIAPDKIHAKGCQYRENLENGRIFYGKNKNV